MKLKLVDVKTHLDTLKALNTLTFPSDDPPSWSAEKGLAWIAYEEGDGGSDPVAFLYCHPDVNSQTAWFFSRVGVMPAARGRGLQRKLMQLMCRRLRQAGVETIVSCTYNNPPSANNFVKERWLTYMPAYPWGADNTIYWYKDL